MRFFLLKTKLVSPAIVIKRRTEFGFKIILDRIPATTLRGALLSSLFYHGMLGEKELEEQVRDPSIVCTPAYPIVDGKKSWPAHPFMCKCKRCEKFYDDREDALEKLEKGERPEIRHTCENGHLALEMLHPKPVTKDCEKADVKSFTSASVGINKNRASFEGGMFYEYDAIGADQEFWAYVACPDRVEFEKGFTFWVGRGVTRGFGEARLESVDELDIKEEAEKCGQAMKGRRLVMYALSPLAATSFDLGEIGRRMGIPAEGRLEVETVYGKESRTDLGWDMFEGRRRFSLRGTASEGSVAAMSVTGNATLEAIAGMLALGVMVVKKTPICGVNQLVPLRGAFE